MRYLVPLLLCVACADLPGAADPAPTGLYRLVSIDARPFAAAATLGFPAPDRVAGQAPCNSYAGSMAMALPAFDPSGISATEIGCDALAEETVFFTALSAMTMIEVAPGQVILTGPGGHSMVFVQP